MPPARFHTNIVMEPGALPCTSSCCCDVTIASAMVGLLSDTRVMFAPTFTTADRPTSRSIVAGSMSTDDPPAVPEPLATAVVSTWARAPGARTITKKTKTRAAARAGLESRGAPGVVQGFIGLLLANDFFGALVAADDLHGRHRLGSGRRCGHRRRTRGTGDLRRRRWLHGRAEQARRPHTGRGRRREV